MTKFFTILILFTLLCSQAATAQESDQQSLRQRTVLVEQTLLLTDSMLISPESIHINDSAGTPLPSAKYRVEGKRIYLRESAVQTLLNDSVTMSYRVLPVTLDQSYHTLDSVIMKPFNDSIYTGYGDYLDQSTAPFDASNLNYNGSFSRGFSVGNAQSLVLNSNFNLQMAGDLGNGIQLSAAISDDNIPIQPEGNTQLLQEFDRVFIKVAKGRTEVTAGDYILRKPKSYFSNYLKKLKGLSIANTSTIGSTSISADANVAVSRGKFARQTLNILEGNQGPYKLVGNNGERFLIVLSGTEKVYLDGRLLERGLEYDYVIDYNRAELIFTPKTLIRRETRIIVEFEYTDQNYLRTLYALNTYISNDKWDVNINFYNEQDSKTATGDIVLDSTDISTLQASGDDLSAARRLGIFSVTDSMALIGRVTYLVLPQPNPAVDTVSFILQYSDDATLPLVSAVFSEVVGGRYAIDETTPVNGRVYTYVGPGNGDYEPTVRLTPPEKKQLLSVGATYKLSEKSNIRGELSMSNNDVNRLSTKDDADNQGFAGMLGYDLTIPIAKSWSLSTEALYEHLDSNYLPLNPYRNAEFARDWNIDNFLQGRQDLLTANIKIANKDSFATTYEYSLYDIEQVYKGGKHVLESKWKSPYGLSYNTKHQLVNSTGLGEETEFSRHLSDIHYRFLQKYTLGMVYDGERNRRKLLAEPLTVLPSSQGYDLLKLYLTRTLSESLTYSITGSLRKDYLARDGSIDITEAIDTKELATEAQWKIAPTHKLTVIAGVRDFAVTDRTLIDNQPSKISILGSIDHTISTLNSAIISTTNYNVSSGQQPKVEFSFVRVPVGQGDYTYIGNEDSTLLNTNFRYAPDLGTGNYIRINQVNGEFVTTNNQVLAHGIRLSPRRLWKEKQRGLRGAISRLSSVSTIRISKKVLSEQGSQFFNLSRSDANVVEYSSLIINTLFVNKGGRAYDVQFSQRSTTSIFTQISGLEERSEDQYSMKTRVKAYKTSDAILETTYSHRQYESETFEVRNFDIDTYTITPSISLRPSANTRVVLDYTYDLRTPRTEGEDPATSHSLGIDINYRQQSAISVTGSFDFTNVAYDGKPNSTIEFDLLQGLRDGRNYIWNTLITKRLKNNIDLTFSYEGRKNGTAAIVHIGRAQVKATF